MLIDEEDWSATVRLVVFGGTHSPLPIPGSLEDVLVVVVGVVVVGVVVVVVVVGVVVVVVGVVVVVWAAPSRVA
jgi:hypothetical protein